VFYQAPACLHPATPQPPNHARSRRDGRSSHRRAHRSSAPTPPPRCPRLCPSHTPASPALCRHADLAHARRLPDTIAPCPRRARGSPSRPVLALPADLALARMDADLALTRMDADLAHARRLPAPPCPAPAQNWPTTTPSTAAFHLSSSGASRHGMVLMVCAPVLLPFAASRSAS
jgi:hypothetical protein